MTQRFDFIVIGAGTAGCVLADRLSASGKHRVLLLEAGGEARSPWIMVPVGYARLLGNPRYNWMYRTEPEPALGDRVLDVPAGRTIGGTGSINGMIYVRGHPADYDAWRDAGNAGWGFDDVLPWFRKAEANTRGADAFHGADGPLVTADVSHRHVLADAFIEAAVQAGHSRNADFNGAQQEGAGYYQLNIDRGRRASTATAYLKRARGRPNLEVVTGALVERIECEARRAVGVRYRHNGIEARADVSKEIVLAAGTFNSPTVLLRSGIGSAQQLQALRLPVVADLPGVGANLQNHYRASVVATCRQPVTLNDAMQSVFARMRMGMQYALTRGGPLSVGTYAGGFFRSSAQQSRPDIQITFWNYSVEKRDARGVVLDAFPGFTANAVLLRPASRGCVTLRSADPLVPPAIVYNHLQDEVDRRTLAAGLALTRRILAMPALAPYFEQEIKPGAQCATEDALIAHALTHGNSVYHPVGTCSMGSGNLAVVDAELRVRGVAGLRVADASVMPTIIAGNTNAPTIMIAERAAQWLLDERTST